MPLYESTGLLPVSGIEENLWKEKSFIEQIINNHLYVIPACRESFLKKDSGQARMTELSNPITS